VLRPDGTCSLTCPSYYFARPLPGSVGGVCDPCIAGCRHCTTPDKCIDCLKNTYLAPSGNCEETCPPGFYASEEEAYAGKCNLCADDCNVCESREVCLQCKDSTFLMPNGHCQTECPPGYHTVPHDKHGVGGTCGLCPHFCSVCESASVCRICSSGTYLTPSSTCRTSCPPGFYKNFVASVGSVCGICPPTCNTCDSSEVCTQCKAGTFLDNKGQCVDICPDGFYGKSGKNGIGGLCKLCTAGCTKCVDATACTDCGPGTFLTPYDRCEVGCPAGFYPSANGVCEVCGNDCNLCKAANICTQCKNAKLLNPVAACLDTCPRGYYKKDGQDGFGGTCPRCPQSCARCLSDTVCTACAVGTYLTSLSKCAKSCPPGFYPDDRKRECSLCPSNCNTCTSAAVCTQCKRDTYLNPNGKCEVTCVTGTYPVAGRWGIGIGGTCRLCPNHCAVCSGPDTCQACKDHRYLTPQGTCSMTCPPGFYQNLVGEYGSTCELCGPDCNLCLSGCLCIQCKNSLYLGPSGNCGQTCPRGFYKVAPKPHGTGGTCQACPAHCDECTETGICLRCKDDYFLDAANRCVQHCPKGFYESRSTTPPGNVCKVCPHNCEICHARGDCEHGFCVRCKPSAHLTSQGLCVDKPQDEFGSFVEPKIEQDVACPSTCSACWDSKTCTACNAGYKLSLTNDGAICVPKL